MTAAQMAAYRRTVNAYVHLLINGRGYPYVSTVDPLYRAFGLPREGKSDAEWDIAYRIQESFRRIGERIARSRGWTGESWFREAQA